MRTTNHLVFSAAVLITVILILITYFFFIPKKDPLDGFVTECSSSAKVVVDRTTDGTVYRKVLNSVERGYIVSPNGEVHEICIQIDTGAGGLTIHEDAAEAWGLMERGKVIPVRSANGRKKRKSINVTLLLAGQYHPVAVATKADRSGLKFAANAGRNFIPKNAWVDPTREEKGEEEEENEK